MMAAVSNHRATRKLSELSDMVQDVSSSLEALCELLQAANTAQIQAGGIHALLQPLERKLSDAAGDLNDMSR